MLQPFLAEDLTNLHFVQPTDWPDITPYFVFYVQNPSFCFPFKMENDCELVGTGVIILNGKSCWLAHIIVRPEYRGKGIGFQITSSLIEMAKQKGCETISLIATNLGRPIYEKLGFMEEDYYLLFDVPDVGLDTFGNSVRDLESPSEIAELDRLVSGEDRIEMLKATFRTGKLFENKDKEVEGYFLPSLGEGLLYAKNMDAVKALLPYRITEGKNRIGVPEANVEGIDFMKANNFTFKNRIVRMVLGKPLTKQLHMVYSRAGGFYG